VGSSVEKLKEAVGNTSKAYRAAMMAMFIIYFIMSWVVMQSIIEVPRDSVNELVLRALIEACLVVSLCHFLVRPYLRLNLVTTSVRITQAFQTIIYLLVVSLLLTFISYGIGYLPFLQSTNVDQIQIFNADGISEGSVSTVSILLLGTGQSLAIFSLWTVTYLMWKFHDNKKQLKSEVDEGHMIRLTTQLHPHFLFNTLNSIRALVFIDKDRAADMITSLAELLRAQMYSQSNAVSSLAEDWQTASTYLEIEKVRFEDHLSLAIDLDPRTKQQKLPSLTVLTLIENAITHGVSTSEHPATIRVTSGLRDSGAWFFTVENSVFTSLSQSGSRLGLRNVRKRLELMFGAAMTFRHERLADHFIVSMELPYDSSACR
jgi:sensor histidine kinase YesM